MVSLSKFLVPFLLAYPGIVSGIDAPRKIAFVPRRGAAVLSKQPELVPEKRVDDKPVVDPDLSAKILAAACFLQGGLLQLVPSQQLEFYGMQGRTDVTHALCSDFGCDVVTSGIITYFALIEKTSANQAVGSAFLYLFLYNLVTLLADRQALIGANNAPIYARLVLSGLGAWATLFHDPSQDEKESNESKLAKAVTLVRLMSGLYAIVSPHKCAKLGPFDGNNPCR
jgi:hypothetical protein